MTGEGAVGKKWGRLTWTLAGGQLLLYRRGSPGSRGEGRGLEGLGVVYLCGIGLGLWVGKGVLGAVKKGCQ